MHPACAIVRKRQHCHLLQHKLDSKYAEPLRAWHVRDRRRRSSSGSSAWRAGVAADVTAADADAFAATRLL
jgi:hypothetical protein